MPVPQTPPYTIDEDVLPNPINAIEEAAASAKFDTHVVPDHKTVICYNSRCADYRVERTDGSACSCKRNTVRGAGDKSPF